MVRPEPCNFVTVMWTVRPAASGILNSALRSLSSEVDAWPLRHTAVAISHRRD